MTLTITKKDQREAKAYADNADCIIGVMLKRRGYTEISVGPFEVEATNGQRQEYRIKNPFRIPRKLYEPGWERVCESAIGKRIELVKV